jgi:hypothetical protein
MQARQKPKLVKEVVPIIFDGQKVLVIYENGPQGRVRSLPIGGELPSGDVVNNARRIAYVRAGMAFENTGHNGVFKLERLSPGFADTDGHKVTFVFGTAKPATPAPATVSKTEWVSIDVAIEAAKKRARRNFAFAQLVEVLEDLRT